MRRRRRDRRNVPLLPADRDARRSRRHLEFTDPRTGPSPRMPPCNGQSRRQSHTDRLIPATGNSRDHNSFDPTRVLKSGATLVRQWRGQTHCPRARGRGRMRRPALSLPNLSGVGPAGLFIPLSDRGALLRLRRLRGVELPVALFDAASPLVPGNGGADMVRASALACSGDFLLRLAGCQGKDLIAEARTSCACRQLVLRS